MDYSSVFFVFLFIFELFILFSCAKLVIKSFSRIFYNLTKSHNWTIYLLAFTFLPGTLIHELAHAITAGVLLVHVGAVELIPEIQEDGVKLGSAQIGVTDPLRRFFIGVAPVLIGISIILGLLIITANSFKDNQVFPFWGYLIVAYLLFEVSNTMFSSKRDMEGAALLMVFIVATLIGFYILGFHQFFSWMGNLLNGGVGQFFKLASLLLFIPIIIDLAAYGLASLMLKR